MQVGVRQAAGIVAIAAVVAGTVIWAAAGRPMPSLGEPVSEQPLRVQVTELERAVRQAVTDPARLPERVRVSGREVPVTLNRAGDAGVVCFDGECLLIDGGRMIPINPDDAHVVREQVRRAG